MEAKNPKCIKKETMVEGIFYNGLHAFLKYGGSNSHPVNEAIGYPKFLREWLLYHLNGMHNYRKRMQMFIM